MGSGKDKKAALKFAIDYRHPVKNGIMNRAEFYSLVSLQCKNSSIFLSLRFYWKLALQKCQKLRFCLFWDSENEQKHIFRLSELAENRTLTIIEDLKWQFRWKLVLQNCLILQIDENIGATMGSDKGKKTTLKFAIDCSYPVEDGIINCADFETYINEHVSVIWKSKVDQNANF